MEEVFMVLPSLDNIPHYPLPLGFSLRSYNPQNGDDETWALVETAAGEFSNIASALEKFDTWTSELPGQIGKRCFFLVDDATNKDVGTITVWEGFGVYKNYGRIHWVAIIPEYQGRGLAKPLISAALSEMKNTYSRAYLKTDDSKPQAIGVYSDFGFKRI